MVFPRWNLSNYQLSGKVDKDARANVALTEVMMLDHVAPEGAAMNVQQKATPLRSLICSHDCEFDKSEIKNRNGILVAPIMPPPDTDNSEAIEALRHSARLNGDGRWDFIHLFPLEIAGSELLVADFSAMMAMGPPSNIRKVLIGMREQEMTDEARAQLQLKLAAFFGRREEPGDREPAD